MKKLIYVLFIFVSCLNAQIFQSIAKDKGVFENKNVNRFYCDNCAMSLAKYYKTNYLYKGHQYASLHCLYEVSKGNIEGEVKVVDAKTMKFIDAKKAYFVVGSSKRGTMSMTSKYAFKNKKDALEFKSKYSGNIMNFEDAYITARNDFQNDLSMINTKKEKKIYKIGKKMYEKKCEQVNVNNFKSLPELKTKLEKVCKVHIDKKLQAIAIYLWDIKKKNKHMRKIVSIKVPKDAKCPICGMFVYKYPKWACMVVYKNKKYYFDGPKDMLKFIFQKGKDNITEMYVSDYFTTKKIDAKKAYFVIGSDVYGPMGKELPAFESDEAAYNFKNDHFGKKVLFYSEITDEVLEYLK
ncbi:nitrous oxide reductase accessory protein NosL [Arcobacter sp. CECT 8985]|uniref:nitrous oxide reductase accessory protein NosL n=1 Tax=Arcobacter sp. CECT 8985 TaxID=1935424 RepID=UPI00100B4E61|nr:nitrous oxide reductase accessory protein NosL [Arcobacter sp. CECT 8985]RXJ87143.1 NosL family protein [Arcobacter sp. CECT 8985]